MSDLVAGYRYFPPRVHSDKVVKDSEILALWAGGRNTYDIALQLGIPESEVANHLPRILEKRRANAEWNFEALHSGTRS